MSLLLDVHPPGYAQAARTMGGELAGSVTHARDDLLSRLDGSGGMGGSDDVGSQWSASSEDAAGAGITGLTNLADSACCLAALLEQTAINYAGAEAASVPEEPVPVTERRWAGAHAGQASDPPSAAGTGVPEPAGWSLLQHEIGRLWPNGHQDLLHASASAWHDTARWLRALIPIWTARSPRSWNNAVPRSATRLRCSTAFVDNSSTSPIWTARSAKPARLTPTTSTDRNGRPDDGGCKPVSSRRRQERRSVRSVHVNRSPLAHRSREPLGVDQ